MRTILIALFISVGFQSYGQNWDWFPLDSLRIYQNPVQHHFRYTGIDFRDYKVEGASHVINLYHYSICDTIHGNFRGELFDSDIGFVISGNSNYGNRIIENENEVMLIFLMTDSHMDTLHFLKNFVPAKEWLVYQNDSLEINGKFKSLEAAGNDSVLTVGITVIDKKESTSRHLSLRTGKEYGISKAPVFYDILFPKTSISTLSEVEWISYREMSEFDFFKCKPGTVFETSGSRREEPDRIDFYRRDSFIETDGNTIKYRTAISSVTVGPGHLPRHHKENNLLSIITLDTTSVINPIPGKTIFIDTFSNPVHIHYRDPIGGFFKCNRYTFRTNKVGDSQRYVKSGDTIFVLNTLSLPLFEKEEANLMQGIGHVVNDQVYCTYINIPGECEWGDRDWRFTSNQQISKPQLIISPNPCSDHLDLRGIPEIVQVDLYDINGRRYRCKHHEARTYLPNVANGVYFIHVLTIKGHYRAKIQIIQNHH